MACIVTLHEPSVPAPQFVVTAPHGVYCSPVVVELPN